MRTRGRSPAKRAATAGEAAGQDPEDEEAAGKMQGVSSGMSSVASDAGSVDSAVTGTEARAESLVADAAAAQEKNTATDEKLAATEGALDQADERLGQLDEQNVQARAQVDALTGQPAQMEAGASDVDAQARAVIDHSTGLEAELRASEESYQSDMRAIPGQQAIAAAAERAGGGASGVIQRSAETAYAGRANVDVLSIFRSPPSAAELRDQERRRLEADERRRARIRDIEARANGDFSSLSTLDRMSIALDVTGENLWNGASEINWPHMAGQVLLAFIDPSVSLEGVIAGLNGVLSGAANLFSLEQWERDPLGNLLKSSADIATGLTTLLGSIAGFCTAILVILGALAIFTFGAMGPVFAAASAFLGPIISTVGGWALVTAAIAAELHALVFIKNLIDAATADTAAELEHESDQMTEDATQFANAASQVVLDRIVEAGGARLANTPTGRSLGAAIETVGRDFDMIPPPRMRPGIDVPAGALAEGAPAATAIAPEAAALPEAAARPAAAAPEPRPVVEAAPPAAAEATTGLPGEPARPGRPPQPPPPPPPPRPEPAATTPPPASTPAHAPEPAAPRAASTPETPPPTTATRPPETPPPASTPAAPRPPERLGGATAEGVGADFQYETFPPSRTPEVEYRRPGASGDARTGGPETPSRVPDAEAHGRAAEPDTARPPGETEADLTTAERDMLTHAESDPGAVDIEDMTGPSRPQPEVGRASVDVAREAGVPDTVYGDGHVFTGDDFPDAVPDRPLPPGREAPDALPTQGREVGRSALQNTDVQADILLLEADLTAAGATIDHSAAPHDIEARINQTQTTAGPDPTRTGTNRPDLQATLPDGRKLYIEDRSRPGDAVDRSRAPDPGERPDGDCHSEDYRL